LKLQTVQHFYCMLENRSNEKFQTISNTISFVRAFLVAVLELNKLF
jgi:hypothetical protein